MSVSKSGWKSDQLVDAQHRWIGIYKRNWWRQCQSHERLYRK